MPTIQVLTPPTAQAEPVTLAEAVAWCRLDLDLVSTDAAIVAQRGLVQMLIGAAREKVEGYTGRYFAAQTLAYTFRLDEPYQLPANATATGVTGFYTTLEALENASNYLVEYQKGISVSRELPLSLAAAQTYTVTATLSGAAVPNLVKVSIMELAAEWYRNRESSTDVAANLLPVSYQVKLAQLVINPIGD